VYRRGEGYAFTYRVRGRQRWGSAATLDEARRRESTRRMYRQMLEHRVIPYFDAERRLRLAGIDPRDVKAFVRWIVEQEDPRHPGRLLSKSTVRQHVAVLRALLGDAMEEGLIRSNPAAGVHITVPEGDGTGRPHPFDKRAMSIDELQRLMGEVPPRWHLFFEFLAHTGLRIGEASELRWGRDVILAGRPYVKLRWQFADGRVCEPKTRYGKRDIPLSPGLVRKLAAVQPSNADGQLVFQLVARHARGPTQPHVQGARAGGPPGRPHARRDEQSATRLWATTNHRPVAAAAPRPRTATNTGS
jgi:integrase